MQLLKLSLVIGRENTLIDLSKDHYHCFILHEQKESKKMNDSTVYALSTSDVAKLQMGIYFCTWQGVPVVGITW